jgi:hypothetical protein
MRYCSTTSSLWFVCLFVCKHDVFGRERPWHTNISSAPKIPIASPGVSNPWQSRESRTLCILQVLSHPSGIKTPRNSLTTPDQFPVPLQRNDRINWPLLSSAIPFTCYWHPSLSPSRVSYDVIAVENPTVEASAFTSRQATGFVSLGLNGISLGHTRRADHYRAHSRWADGARSHLYWCSQCPRSGSSPS